MPLADALKPFKELYLPVSDEPCVMVLVPQQKVFGMNKEVKKYLASNDLTGDMVATKMVYEAAVLVHALRKPGTVNLAEDNRGEPLFHSIDSFLSRFTDFQQDWLMAHYEILKNEVLPPLAQITEEQIEKLYQDMDAGKDVSPQLKSFGYASLLSFTHSLASRLRQLREESLSKNSPTGYSLSERSRKKSALKAARVADQQPDSTTS